MWINFCITNIGQTVLHSSKQPPTFVLRAAPLQHLGVESFTQTQKWVNDGTTLLSDFHFLKLPAGKISSLTSGIFLLLIQATAMLHLIVNGEQKAGMTCSSGQTSPSPTTFSASCITLASSRTVAAHWRDVLFCEQIRNVDMSHGLPWPFASKHSSH